MEEEGGRRRRDESIGREQWKRFLRNSNGKKGRAAGGKIFADGYLCVRLDIHTHIYIYV